MENKLNEGRRGQGWLFHHHYNPQLQDDVLIDNSVTDEEEKRRRLMNPYLGMKPHQLDEGVTGSAWMFYHHYNPEILKAMQKILVGHQVEDVVDELMEVTHAAHTLCKGSCPKCIDGTCDIGRKLNCPYQARAEKKKK